MIAEFNGNNRWLSNFYPCRIAFRGKRYPSVEYAYLSAKSEDKEWKKLCAEGKFRPYKLKKKSKHLPVLPNWEIIKLEVMRKCLLAKFSQEPFKSKLLETGNQHLQEGNTWGDTFWGIDLDSGEGANHLGKLIMDIRAELTAK